MLVLLLWNSQIRSDKDKEESMYYSLLGPGASKEPVNLFIVEEMTGLVYIRGKLDREERETYIVSTHSVFMQFDGLLKK